MDIIAKEALHKKVPRGADQKEDLELCHSLGYTKVQHDLRGHRRMLVQPGRWGIGGFDQLDNVVHAHNSFPPCCTARLLDNIKRTKEERKGKRGRIKERKEIETKIR